MPSFDVVSEVDIQEARNAVDQASREMTNRFDFKGANASYEFKDNQVVLVAKSKFQIEQMQEILEKKLVKRAVDIGSLNYQDITENINQAKQIISIIQGVDKDLCRKIVKIVKDSKVKVQAAIQGEQVRVTGKKRDELQQIISILKNSDIKLPLQFSNFRD